MSGVEFIIRNQKMINNNLYYEGEIKCPLKLIHNPYLCEMKAINYNYIKKIIINKTDVSYISNSINMQNKEMIKNIDKQINKLSNEQFLISCGSEITNNIDISSLNNDEIYELNKYKKNVKNEINRVNTIRKIFINEYINATKLKKAHLSHMCGKRKGDNTSKCMILDFLFALDKEGITKQNITIKYNQLLLNNKINNIKIDNNHIPMCYIIIKIYDLFNYYIGTLIYSLKILEDRKELIRYDDIYLFDFNKYKYFILTENNSIIIKHMDIIQNITLETNKCKIYKNVPYIKLFKTPKRNDIIFENMI